MSYLLNPGLRLSLLCVLALASNLALMIGAQAATPVKVMQQSTNFSGQLTSGNDKWNRMTTINVLSGQEVFYETISIHIQTGGPYSINVTSPDFAGALNTYAIAFNAAQSKVNFWDNGVVVGSPGAFGQTTFFAPGDYDLVISTNRAGEKGLFSGSISGPGPITIKPPPPLAIQTNPFDATIKPGQTATLKVSTVGRTPKTFQWFQGNSGDTSNPINGATDASFTTPALNAETQYWVRVSNPDGSVDSASATVFITNGPIQASGVLTPCDDKFNRLIPRTNSGDPIRLSNQIVPFKLFRFRVWTEGTYTIQLQTNGFRGVMYLYDGVFLQSNATVNFSGNSAIGNNVTLTQTLLASPNIMHLVIAAENSTDVGSFTVTVTQGPAFVNKIAAPEIASQTSNLNVRRNQAVTLKINAAPSDISYQWFSGNCSAKSIIAGENNSSFTTPPPTQNIGYVARLENPGGYLYSQVINLTVVPFAPDFNADPIPQDQKLTVAAPGVLSNATAADGSHLTAVKVSDPAHGTVTLNGNGSFVYQPVLRYNGPDSFTFRVSDGELQSDPVKVNIRVLPTFANGNSITIPSLGQASPYPSTINVSGLTGTINKVIVTLDRLHHENEGDLDILLVGPQGQALILMSDANGDPDNPFVFDRVITFDDAATDTIFDGRALFDGAYRPVNYGGGDSFPAPAPATFQSPAPAGTATLASVFNGTDPNGTWKLFIVDDQQFFGGSLPGWSLTIGTRPPCQAVTISPSLLPQPALNSLFPTTTLTASGGTGAVTFKVSEGALPTGLTLTAEGDLKGTPTQGGTFNFKVLATDQYGCTGQQSYSLTVICPAINVRVQP